MEVTKEIIKEHIKNVGHCDSAILKICGWLVGKGLKASDEVFKFKKGDGTFDEFLYWANGGINIRKGDMITVKNGVTVLAIGDMSPKYKFVGFDGFRAKVYDVNCCTRYANKEEKDMLNMEFFLKGIKWDSVLGLCCIQ